MLPRYSITYHYDRSSLSYSRTIPVCQFTERAERRCQCLPFKPSEMRDSETPTFISSALWPQHPDPNIVNYKLCAEMQQRVYLRKVHNVHGLTLWRLALL